MTIVATYLWQTGLQILFDLDSGCAAAADSDAIYMIIDLRLGHSDSDQDIRSSRFSIFDVIKQNLPSVSRLRIDVIISSTQNSTQSTIHQLLPSCQCSITGVMSTSSSVPADIGKIAEPLLLGHLLQWALFGALSVQVYVYYLAFPNDSLQIKLLVYGVYTIELVQAVLLARMAFIEFAAGFGNFEAINTIGLLSLAVPILSSIVTAVVQIFYAYRIKKLANSYLIPSVVVLCALIQLGGGLAVGVVGFQMSSFSHLLVKQTLIASGLWNGSSALCDVIIASYMTYYLSYWQKKTPFKQTQRMLQRLSRLIIETGTLTAVIAIINLVMYQIPGVTYYQTTSAVLGKIYSNTMMMNLVNSRMPTYDTTNFINVHVSNELSTDPRRPMFSTSHGGISVTREEWTDEESSSRELKTAGKLEHRLGSDTNA